MKNKQEFKELEKFIERFGILHITTAISAKAVELFEEYRLSYDVKIADMLIASCALAYDVELLSKNQRDFRFIDDLKLIKYIAE